MYLDKSIMIAFMCIQILSLISVLNGQEYAQNGAQTIFDATDKNATAALVLISYNFEECQKINAEYTKLTNGVPIVEDVSRYAARNPDATLADFIFAKIYGQEFTKIIYLKSALQGQFTQGSENILLQILIIEDSHRAELISSYNHHSSIPFLDGLKKYQNEVYRNFLEKLCSTKREEKEPEEKKIDETVKLLLAEMKNNAVDEQLNYALMNVTMQASVNIINKYAKANNGVTLRDAVAKKFTNADQRFCYQSLIDFILNQHLYMANRIHDSINDSNDRRASIILQIVGNAENGEMTSIRKEFLNAYKKSVHEFLMEKNKEIVIQRLIDVQSNICDPAPPPEPEFHPKPEEP